MGSRCAPGAVTFPFNRDVRLNRKQLSSTRSYTQSITALQHLDVMHPPGLTPPKPLTGHMTTPVCPSKNVN